MNILDVKARQLFKMNWCEEMRRKLMNEEMRHQSFSETARTTGSIQQRPQISALAYHDETVISMQSVISNSSSCSSDTNDDFDGDW